MEFQQNSKRFPKDFQKKIPPKNSQRIPKEFSKIPKEFPKYSRRIPKENNSERIPKEFQKNSKRIPKEFQKNSQKNSQDFENITHVNFPIPYIALQGRKRFRACLLHAPILTENLKIRLLGKSEFVIFSRHQERKRLDY